MFLCPPRDAFAFLERPSHALALRRLMSVGDEAVKIAEDKMYKRSKTFYDPKQVSKVERSDSISSIGFEKAREVKLDCLSKCTSCVLLLPSRTRNASPSVLCIG